MLHPLEIETYERTEFIDITPSVADAVARSGMKSGAAIIYVPHTTAACTINENADPAVKRDILTQINATIPFDGDYHHGEGNSAAHIKASLFGASQFIPVQNGKLLLGTWQGIFFCEFDGPRRRKAYVQLVENFGSPTD